MTSDEPLALGIDPGTRHMGLTFVQKRTLIAEIMDVVDIHIYHDEEYTYSHDHYHAVAMRLVRKYHQYLSRCTIIGSEKVVVAISDKDVMVFIAHFLDAIRYTYPQIVIVSADSQKVRPYWGVTIKRTKSESKKLSLNAKRLQNKKSSLTAPLMSLADKLRYEKHFKIYETIKKGKGKGKKKLVKLHDAWESAMIAVYCIKNESLLTHNPKMYLTRKPTTKDAIMRIRNVQLFESKQSHHEEPPKKKRKT